MKNKKMFMEYMTGLGEIFNKEISNILKDVYWKALENYTDEKCEAAFKQVIATCKFFPKPAELIEILQGSKEDQSIDAWQQVIDALKTYHPDFPESKPSLPPEIQFAIDHLGGLDVLATMSYDELKWQEKRFREMYEYEIDGKTLIDSGDVKMLQ